MTQWPKLFADDPFVRDLLVVDLFRPTPRDKKEEHYLWYIIVEDPTLAYRHKDLLMLHNLSGFYVSLFALKIKVFSLTFTHCKKGCYRSIKTILYTCCSYPRFILLYLFFCCCCCPKRWNLNHEVGFIIASGFIS